MSERKQRDSIGNAAASSSGFWTMSCLFAAMLLCVATGARAQNIGTEPAKSSGRFFFGGGWAVGSFGIGATTAPFTGGPWGETNLSVHFGMRLIPELYLEGLIVGHVEFDNDDDQTEVVSPGPGGILWTLVTAEGIPHYPYGSTAAKLVFEPGSESARVRPRLFGGTGWIWGQSSVYLNAGVGISAGSARTRFVLDVGGQWFESSYRVIERTYDRRPRRDSGAILLSEESVNGSVNTSGLVVRAGVHVFPGRRNR